MQRTVVKDDYVELVSSDEPRIDPALATEGSHGRYRTGRFRESTFIDRDYYVQITRAKA
jgi:hypothetical protein